MCITYAVNVESIKTGYKKTIHIHVYIYFFLLKKTHAETLNKDSLDFFHFD